MLIEWENCRKMNVNVHISYFIINPRKHIFTGINTILVQSINCYQLFQTNDINLNEKQRNDLSAYISNLINHSNRGI